MLEKVLKSPVVVANKTGAAGAVGMSFVASSKPDGYTLLMALSSISIIPEADKLFDRKPAYTMDQLMPIALISADPTIFVVNASRPWKSVKEFVADAKKSRLNIGSIPAADIEKDIQGLFKLDPALISTLKDVLYK